MGQISDLHNAPTNIIHANIPHFLQSVVPCFRLIRKERHKLIQEDSKLIIKIQQDISVIKDINNKRRLTDYILSYKGRE